MRLLVLGGSGFLGRHVAADAVARGWSVTTFNRGTAPAPDGVTAVVGDRLRPADLEPLTRERWDAVVDTWSAAPSAVRDSARALAPVAERYVYVSSGSVYATLAGGPDERTPTVDADPDAGGTDYAADKRGAELAAEREFGAERVAHLRAGLILGPGEDIGRLPWWLTRIARGGRTLAPGPPDLGLQWIDARDLAAFANDLATSTRAGAAEDAGRPEAPTHRSGPFNAVGRPDAASMADVLHAITDVTGSDAELVWLPPAAIAAAGIEPWTDLPLYLPPGDESRGMLAMDVTRAHAAGLRTRPLRETVADTWAWLQAIGGTAPQRPDRPVPGLDPQAERDALAAFTSA